MLGFVTNAFKSYGGMDCCSSRKTDQQQYTTLQPNQYYLQQSKQQQQQQDQFEFDTQLVHEDYQVKNENFDISNQDSNFNSDPIQQSTKNFKKNIREQRSSNNSSSAHNSKKFDKIQKPAKGSSKQDVKNWSKDEEERLREAIDMFSKDWDKVAQHVKSRNATQCEQKWSRIREPRAVQKWSDAEDDLIRQVMKEQPVDKKKIWGYISQQLLKQLNTNRNSKQVRERFINILDDNINKDPWTEQEDQIIIEKFLEYGPKWSLISTHLRGRPENKVKNHFYSYIRKNFNVPEIQQHQIQKKIPQANGNGVNNHNNNMNGNGINHIQQEYPINNNNTNGHMNNNNNYNGNGNNYENNSNQMDQEFNNNDIMIKQEEPNFMQQNSFEFQNGGGVGAGGGGFNDINNQENNFLPHQGFVPPQQTNAFNEPQGGTFNPNRQFSFASSQDSHQGSYYSCYYSDCQNDDTVYFGKEKGKHIHKRKINFSLSNGSRRSINDQEVVVENEYKQIENEEQRKAIDSLMVEIDKAKNGGEQEKLLNYYEQLQNICSNLGETLQHQQ